MKTIKVTHIDTAGHGYYSVSKKDFLLMGGDPKKITGCSGHTLTRLYLEEDCDGTYLFDLAKEKGFVIVTKSSYNPKFSKVTGYKPELFDYTPTVGDQIDSHGSAFLITELKNAGIYVRHMVTRMVYKIPESNPFNYITALTVKGT